MGVRGIKAVNSEATPPPVPPCWWVLGFWRGSRRRKPPRTETREQALEQRLLGTFRRRDLPKTNDNKKNVVSTTPFGWGKRNEEYALRCASVSVEVHLPRRTPR